MLVRTAEESFEKGMRALEDDRWREALAFFEAAIELERRSRVAQPQARYLSYYGLCLGVAGKKRRQAVEFCRKAVDLEEYNPDMHWNLGRVLLAAERRREAHQALRAGLCREPNHAGLRRELRRMGLRKRPVVGFLSRGNPVNVMLGKMRYRNGNGNGNGAGPG